MADRSRVGISLLYVAPERIAGVSTYVFGLTRALLQRRAFEYVLFVPIPLAEQWSAWLKGLDATLLPCGPHPDARIERVIFEQLRLPALARRQRLNAVYFPHTIAPRWRLPATVVTVHDLMPLSKPTDFSWHKRAYLSWTYRKLARSTDQFVTVSEFSRGELQAKLGIPRDQVVVTPNALDDVFREKPGPLPPELQPAGPYVLSVGGTFPHKRLDRVIDAFSMIAEASPELHLVMAGTFTGSADGLDRIRAHAQRSGLGDRIRFLPRIERCHLASLYFHAETFVTASEFEGFGIPVIEALAMGCPVAATPADGILESLGGFGTVASDFSLEALAAAMRRARQERVTDPVRIEAGRRFALDRYTWDNAAYSLERSLRAAAERAAKPGVNGLSPGDTKIGMGAARHTVCEVRSSRHGLREASARPRTRT